MPKPKIIKSDGRVYTFTPGENGSLTTPADPAPVWPAESVHRAKVIMPSDALQAAIAQRKQGTNQPSAEQLVIRKKRQGVVSTLAATRG